MVREQLEAVARKHGVRLLVQFGSSISGRMHPRSDVDLGVLLERVPESFDALADLVGDLQALVDGREVDVAILNRADPLFLNRVVEGGALLYGSVRAFQELKIYAYSVTRIIAASWRWSASSSPDACARPRHDGRPGPRRSEDAAHHERSGQAAPHSRARPRRVTGERDRPGGHRALPGARHRADDRYQLSRADGEWAARRPLTITRRSCVSRSSG